MTGALGRTNGPLETFRPGVAVLSAVLLLGLTVVGDALAVGKRSWLRMGQIAYRGGNWNPRPTALSRLLWTLAQRTSVETGLRAHRVAVSDRKLFEHPLLYITGDRSFPPWPKQDVRRLRRHLAAGGTLIADAADARVGQGFDRSFRRLAGRLFPKLPLRQVKPDHTLLKSFYLVRRFGGRVLVRPYVEAVERDDRAMIVYSLNDLGGAWARDDFGAWTHPVTPGGARQREGAFRLGINLVMYALCGNYKRDQVHVPFIIRRRKR